MVKVKKIDTPKPQKTKIYWSTIPLALIPFIGFAIALNGFVRSVLSTIKSIKIKKIDKRAVTGIILSSVALLVGTVSIDVTLNPTPTISVSNVVTDTDDSEYTLGGEVSGAGNGVVKFAVNGTPVQLKGSLFSYKTHLREGDNKFNLVATNDNGVTEKTITVHRTTRAEIDARKKHSQPKATKKADSETQTNNDVLYINNAYYKGKGKYDVVVYSSSKDTLRLYVNDKNPTKAWVNKDGWATFKRVDLSGRSKISFAKKNGWFKYQPIDYVKYISVSGEQITIMSASDAHKLEKAEARERTKVEAAKAKADAKAKKAEAKARAEAKAKKKAKHKKYINKLASTYCANHQGNRNIYIPRKSSRSAWEDPNEKLVTKYPTHSSCVTIMKFFVDTMPSDNIKNVTKAKVGTGMNTAEVLAAWGWPNNNSNSSSVWGSSGTWMWNTGTCYYGVCSGTQYVTFYNGKVTSTGNI